jgi:predicted Zn finger-like uncharacterized protein
MLIICPSCATAYDVEVASLRPAGRQVRCVRCRAVWQAELNHADKLLAAAEALGPAQGFVDEAPVPFAKGPVLQPGPEPAAEAAGEAAWADASADRPPGDEQPADGQSAAAQDSEGRASADQPNEPAEVEAPPIAPVDLDQGRLPAGIDADHFARGVNAPEDIETVAARRLRRSTKRRPMRWPLSHLQSAILVLLLVDTVLVGWRNDLVRALPQTASFYALMGLPVNLRGLVFDGITTATEQHEGVPILVVEGNIVNDARKVVEVPRLKFIVRNAARQEIYSWTAVPARAALPPGETVSFHTRLASPPPEARDVLVRFANRRDMIGAAR